ncbi:MAG: hypothetical protein V4530_17670 [Pseudomonadota bacterium]
MKIKALSVALILAAIPVCANAQTGDAIAELTTKSGKLGTALPGKAMVVFYRPGSLMGMAMGCTIREGKDEAKFEIARLGSGKYWAHSAEPGKHDYRTEGERSDLVSLNVEPGQTYFVKCVIGVGIAAGSARIEASDAADFAKKSKGLTLWEPKAQ